MKNLRLVELCSGIGAQAKGLEHTGLFHVESVATADLDKEVVVSYAAIHCGLTNELIESYENYPSKEEMAAELTAKRLGYDFKNDKPYDWYKLSRKKDKTKGIEKYWLADHLSHNLGDMMQIDALPDCDFLTYFKNGSRNIEENIKSGKGYEGIIEKYGCDKSHNSPQIIERANCITAKEDKSISNHKSEGTAVIEKIGNINPSGKGINGNVFGENGLAPTLTTNKGEGPKIATYSLNGYLLHTDENGNIKTIVAMRGRNPENPSDRTVGAPTEQRLEVNINEVSNCLTTVQKDNLVMEGELLLPYIRIRKLTPKECHRLMGFDDIDVDRCKAVGMSDAQGYKQAGNSIVTNVIALIAEHFYKAQYDESYKCLDEKMENFQKPQME